MGGCWVLLLVALGWVVGAIDASDGDADPMYMACVNQCEMTGSLKDSTIEQCPFSLDDLPVKHPWHKQEPLYLQWKQWNCKTECRYRCMVQREEEREGLGLEPVKYHRRWPFKRVFVFQEPVSAALSALNLLVQFNGWLSFFLLLYYKLPLRPQSHRTYYEFTCLWHIYGLLSMNAWFWSAIHHCQNCNLTEKLDYSSAAAFIGFSLILAILRIFKVTNEASRVMVVAPLLAFLTTHILYLNFHEFDYGLNMKVCVAMIIAQVLLWTAWAIITSHPSGMKLWTVAIGVTLVVLLEIYDFPPVKGYVDAHALCHALSIPLSNLWWSFIKEDAEFRTSDIMKKVH
ncbi:uncharacterized protein [Typha latifolia]|uniref:uncharacterized protein n=1 Tax=Typha latifolia TaxID=4733 RepID=UPI003C300784